VPNKPGFYQLRAPLFTDQDKARLWNFTGRRQWTILNSDFQDQWLNKTAKPTEPILSVGLKEGPWEIELKIPQKHIGQVLAAFERFGKDDQGNYRPLEVDFLLKSDPTKTYKGLLRRNRIAAEATPARDETSEAEPVVIAYVDVEDAAIPEADRLPVGNRVAGTEVHAKVRCGNHAMGYSLFYGVWEFMYEKVVFFF
jgi:hypothetical protein